SVCQICLTFYKNMLQELDIRDFALIDRLKIEFSAGLNILTGETGAGKSIIIGAMELVLGERASVDVIRTGSKRASINSVFDIQKNSQVSILLKESEMEDPDDNCFLLLSRDVVDSGRSRSKINEQTSTLTVVREIGNHLVDIHGQHQHQMLFQQEKHMDILDNFGGLMGQRQNVVDLYKQFQKLRAKYDRLLRQRKEKLREKDLLEFQLKELQDANLLKNEEEKLQQERQILSNAEELFELASGIYKNLYDTEEPTLPSVLDVLKTLETDIAKLTEIDKDLKDIQNRFESIIYELEDIAGQMRDYSTKVEFDPQRLSEIETRLDIIYRLKRKYMLNSLDELIEYRNELENQLNELTLSSEMLEDLRKEIKTVVNKASKAALNLSEERQKHARRLKSLVEKELKTLGMERTIFEVQVNRLEDENGIIENEGKKYKLEPEGIDFVEFLISPNPGEELRPLAKIASGGEISRIMLAIKTVLAQTGEFITMIFDEIDTGIGGRIAEVVGRKMKELSKNQQVICITHLPQIASLADSHFKVRKEIVGDRTVVYVEKLTYEERTKEVARMLAGEKITDVTMAHAKEMIEQAKEA
ncbi:DNA repair protein RecN, partial [Candidatus Poribacteria bacterium]|nr:DNA repair protein RecN [Candidatus Poribacteria bacterium]